MGGLQWAVRLEARIEDAPASSGLWPFGDVLAGENE
jgi:hypothetical protein